MPYDSSKPISSAKITDAEERIANSLTVADLQNL
jgi:hypothetical protein